MQAAVVTVHLVWSRTIVHVMIQIYERYAFMCMNIWTSKLANYVSTYRLLSMTNLLFSLLIFSLKVTIMHVLIFSLKVTVMQVWKLHFMLAQYKNNTLKISLSWTYDFSSYLPVKFAFFLKNRLLFNIFYCKQTVVHISQKVKCYNVKPSACYFYAKTEDISRFSYLH